MYCIMHYTTIDLAVGDLRNLLTNLGRPDPLDTPWTRELLRAHGRLPANPSPLTVGTATAKLLTEKIAELKESSDDTWAQRLPHSVLETCFVRGRKNQQAAQNLGLSERQLSRERTRAVQLLASNLAPPATTRVSLDHPHYRQPPIARGASASARLRHPGELIRVRDREAESGQDIGRCSTRSIGAR